MVFLPSSPFGTAVEQLAVHLDDPFFKPYPVGRTGFGALMEQISLLPSLRELRIWAPISRIAWQSASSAFPMALRALPSPATLSALTVIIENYSTITTRIQFLSSLSEGKVDDVLRRFSNLSLVRFEITETKDCSHDSAWWEDALRVHLPGLRGIMAIEVKITASGQYFTAFPM